MERDISVRPTEMTRPVTVDHLQSWSLIFRSDQTEIVRSIWSTNRNFRNFGLNGKRPKLPVSKPWTQQRNYHRKLKTIKIVHTPAKLKNDLSLLFRRELKRIWNRLEDDKTPPGTFTERDETKRCSIRQGGVDVNSKPDQNGFNFGVEVNSPFYPRTVKTLTSGDERILETARLVNSPEFERLRENAKYQTLKHWKSRIPSDPNSRDSMELSRIAHFLISKINVCKYPSFNRDVFISYR